MSPAEGIPVTIGEVTVGKARVNDDGTIELAMDAPNAYGQELLGLLERGMVFAISLSPVLNPAIDGKLISRLLHERSITEFGGLRPEHITNNQGRHF